MGETPWRWTDGEPLPRSRLAAELVDRLSDVRAMLAILGLVLYAVLRKYG
ncbi:MAG: hypothetical protein LC777_06400 [Actinobacteria bacterium]|nr:hypothetical protein [Actinomycetota bacterium]